ncbi:hypothetical protein BASA50_006292 [Batrachochytrium salamandrivorans]|uniref:SRP54-type proteins GTP-binding domain-containing protein n=1 Tax=Batrachochytrium salamandrivorans TaxID=1357716 RepID=A0ABQ8FAT8_9FUNG|nr:hypothetical protein BASA50_006292 [Batrachochytrium salamandrivorans]
METEDDQLLALYGNVLLPITAGKEKQYLLSEGVNLDDAVVLFENLTGMLQGYNPSTLEWRFRLAAKLVNAHYIDLAQELKHILLVKINSTPQPSASIVHYTIFDQFIYCVIETLCLHQCDRETRNSVKDAEEKESRLFHLIMINDHEGKHALDRCIKLFEETQEVDMYILRDIGLCVVYTLVAHENTRRFGLNENDHLDEKEAVETNQREESDRIINSISKIIMLSGSISASLPSRSTIHHAFFLISTLLIHCSVPLALRPYTISCLFQWLEAHWLLINVHHSDYSIDYQARAVIDLSFFEVDRSHDIHILEWLWRMSDGVDQWQNLVGSITHVWLEAQIETIRDAFAEKLDTKDLVVKVFELATLSQSIRVVSETEWMKTPAELPPSWSRIILYMVVALANILSASLENKNGESTSIPLFDFSADSLPPPAALLQAIQSHHAFHLSSSTGSLNSEVSKNQHVTTHDEDRFNSLITHINYAMLTISVDISIASQYASMPMLIDSLLLMITDKEYAAAVLDHHCIQTSVVFFIETLLIVKPAHETAKWYSTLAKMQSTIRSRMVSSGSVCSSAIDALRRGSLASILGWLRLASAVYIQCSSSGPPPVQLKTRRAYAEFWSELLSSLLRGFPCGCNQAIVGAMHALYTHIGPSCHLAAYLLDNRWCMFVLEAIIVSLLQVEGHWRWILDFTRLVVLGPPTVKCHVRAWISSIGLVAKLRIGPHYCAAFKTASISLADELSQRLGSYPDKDMANDTITELALPNVDTNSQPNITSIIDSKMSVLVNDNDDDMDATLLANDKHTPHIILPPLLTDRRAFDTFPTRSSTRSAHSDQTSLLGMIDQVSILTRGGAVLWSRRMTVMRTDVPNPLNSLISEVFIEERAGLDSYLSGPYLAKWVFANEIGLVFVAVHQSVLSLPHMDALLNAVKTTFCARFAEIISDISHIDTYAEYDDIFDAVLEAVEEKTKEAKKNKVPRSFKDSKKYANTLEGSQQKKPEILATAVAELIPGTTSSSPSTSDADTLASKLEKLAKRGVAGRKSVTKRAKAPDVQAPLASKTKKGKQMRAWDASGGSISIDPHQKLDFSESVEEGTIQVSNLIGESMGVRALDGSYDALEMDDPDTTLDNEDEDKEGDSSDAEEHVTALAANSKPTASGSSLFSFFTKWTSSRTLTEVELESAMIRIKEHLINKNVAADIASLLCQSVKSGLVGKKTGPFKALDLTIRELMEVALSRILTPGASTDVLRDINVANTKGYTGKLGGGSSGRPYTFAFIGVNGVGKSTNLSKICFWLLQNKKRVLIAACDTFRSGAVEQLRVHCRNLKELEKGAVVDLFDRGYGKDPAAIAKDAIAYATAERYDVVLIDTAGRMQDNEPLMRALAKLISTNNPDKILFVGEALVGNGAVDQLSKFNQALRDFSGMRVPRQIDGMILTKFDTIDDKVGAALSMTYTTGKPILFVGTGQTYTDLRKLNVKSVVGSLLK